MLVSFHRPHERVIADVPSDSETQTHWAEFSDINRIVAKYRATGHLEATREGTPFYGDLTNAGDLATALSMVEDATERFMELPSSIRSAADNDPIVLLSMLETSEGRLALEAAGAAQEHFPPGPNPGSNPPDSGDSGGTSGGSSDPASSDDD